MKKIYREVTRTEYYNDGTQRDFKVWDFFFIQFFKAKNKRYKTLEIDEE